MVGHAADVLQNEQFMNSGAFQNVMAAVNAVEAKPERLRQFQRFRKTQASGIVQSPTQQFLRIHFAIR